MKHIVITINGKKYAASPEETILEAAEKNGITIPTLCFLKDLHETGACRMCVVEIKGEERLQASCVTPVREGMEILTHSPKVRTFRRANLELILSNHPFACYACDQNGYCHLQFLAETLNITALPFKGKTRRYEIDLQSPAIIRDNSKCIVCRRCVSVCRNGQGVSALAVRERGFQTTIGPIYGKSLDSVGCIQCGQCIQVCPTGALTIKSHKDLVWSALDSPEQVVAAQLSPAAGIALGEALGLSPDTDVLGKVAGILRSLGFDFVFHTGEVENLFAEEEAYALVERLKKKEKLPMFASQCPGWVSYCEHFYPEYLENLSRHKSSRMSMGILLKYDYGRKKGLEPKQIFVVSVSPCTAEKEEIQRPDMVVDGINDVDAVLTTMELVKMIKEAGILPEAVKEEAFDRILPNDEKFGMDFDQMGNLTEKVLYAAGVIWKGAPLNGEEFAVRWGKDGEKEVTVCLEDVTLKAVAISGMHYGKKLLEQMKKGKKQYHFVEWMACPQGCIMGGGQPLSFENKNRCAYREKMSCQDQALQDTDVFNEQPKERRYFLSYPHFYRSFSKKDSMPLDLLKKNSYHERELF